LKRKIILLDKRLFHYRNDYEDDEEDDNERINSKWSRPVMQKQRMAYMSNLNRQKKSSAPRYAADHFSET
jgi:hypothetical protein